MNKLLLIELLVNENKKKNYYYIVQKREKKTLKTRCKNLSQSAPGEFSQKNQASQHLPEFPLLTLRELQFPSGRHWFPTSFPTGSQSP